MSLRDSFIKFIKFIKFTFKLYRSKTRRGKQYCCKTFCFFYQRCIDLLTYMAIGDNIVVSMSNEFFWSLILSKTKKGQLNPLLFSTHITLGRNIKQPDRGFLLKREIIGWGMSSSYGFSGYSTVCNIPAHIFYVLTSELIALKPFSLDFRHIPHFHTV